MNELADYILLGFDIRQKVDVIKSVDVSVWPQSEDGLRKLHDIGYKDNLVQLIDCDEDIIEMAVGDNSISVAIAVSSEGLHRMEEILFHDMIEHPKSPLYLLSRGWVFDGFDIADGNGYFSIFGIDCLSSRIDIPSNLFLNKKDADFL